MAKDVRVRVKLAGLNKVMRSPGVQAKVNEEAGRMAARAGAKFRVTPSPHRWTARAFVEPRPGEHLTDAERLALLRSVDGAGG